MNGEMAEFFETWLSRQYQTTVQVEDVPEIMVVCPTVQLRYGELAGVIRFRVAFYFEYANGDGFQVPTRSERKKGRLPLPPVQVRMKRIPVSEGLPFFIDGRLLYRQLSETKEEVSALFDQLNKASASANTPRDTLGLLASHLDGQSTKGSEEALLDRIVSEVSRRLNTAAHKGRGYPIAIVLDGSRAKTTWYLQRELARLIHAGKMNGLPLLHSYLTGKKLETGARSLLGLFRDRAISESQTLAAQKYLGSEFTAVEGPPGTGKTTLILHLAAHQLVKHINRYAVTSKMPTEVMLVASTNNRAVDNVIDALTLQQNSIELPIALRGGSRRICQRVLALQLKQALQWMDLQMKETSVDEREKTLKSALERFNSQRRALDTLLSPLQEREAVLDEQSRLKQELKELEGALEGDAPEELYRRDLSIKKPLSQLKQLEHRLVRLSGQCEGKATKKRIHRVRRYFDASIKLPLESLLGRLNRLGWSEKIFTVPSGQSEDLEETLASWEDAAENAIDRCIDMRESLEKARKKRSLIQQRNAVMRKLDKLKIPEETVEDVAKTHPMRHALFHLALDVRNAYAARHAESLRGAVSAAMDAVEDHASLRLFSHRKPRLFEKLCEIFPIWGSTLLSLGNLFDDHGYSVDQVIIDEAGQCHPAYAVSALMRGAKGMILGDIHQLTPIFGLTEADERPVGRRVLGKTLAELDEYRIFDKSRASAQGLAQSAMVDTTRLIDHFRCQREIIDISNRLCGYGLTIHTSPIDDSRRVPTLETSRCVIPIFGEQERQGGSWFNRAEADAVVNWVFELLRSGIPPEEIAVITPYRGQLFFVRRTLLARGVPVEASAELFNDGDEEETLFTPAKSGVAIGTVHRFQGGERRVVLFTTVVTQVKSLPFLNERVNLINVAVSRAKDYLLVIGHPPTLAEGRHSRFLLDE